MEGSVNAVMSDARPSKPVRRKPGPKPGSRHNGMFAGGFDERRWLLGPQSPTVKKDFQSKVREMTDDALQVLQDCLSDSEASWKEKQAAVELILSHGHGLPVNRGLMAQTDESGQDAQHMSTEQILKALSAPAREYEALVGFIEGELE